MIYGPTGVGKSTLFDAPMWVLFGETSKNGGVDDIRSWDAPDHTYGYLSLKVSNKFIRVSRVRGKGHQNDLYWTETGIEGLNRGKDITETQNLLNQRLGVNSYTYSLGSYYNEVSPSALFFTAKPNERRQLFESIADLSFPTTLGRLLVENKKEETSHLKDLTTSISNIEGKIQQLTNTTETTKKRFREWEVSQLRKVTDLIEKTKNWESDRSKRFKEAEISIKEFQEGRHEKVKDIKEMLKKTVHNFVDSVQCNECGALRSDHQKEMDLMIARSIADQEKELNRRNPYIGIAKGLMEEQNVYDKMLEQAREEKNPFLDMLRNYSDDAEELLKSKETLGDSVVETQSIISSLEHLISLNDLLRAELVKNTIKSFEQETNIGTGIGTQLSLYSVFEGQKGSFKVYIWLRCDEGSI